ncbi:uncharacterized protein I206_104261 [Kwoniella pini CBS 10737]|uniref:AAA+ ATPase domain-containing protein n=1 Tax=Kwoniella pini CBS 10737 TaxID=1296096 RepID=A0A1B9I2G8_9TREE|nr:uncharacterized protein I206_04163 [Kwoniella pini CBS 10737]OCF49641.1 hypothetical protein I206_04163 [Kwoniella pini CBS 10737]
MPSTPSEGSTSSSIPTDTSNLAGPSRPIHSFFGGSSSSSNNPGIGPNPISPNGNGTARKRRKKDENQAKLSVVGNGSENVNWVMGKPEPELIRRSDGLGMTRTRGEEDEIADMVNGQNHKGKGKGKRKSDIHNLAPLNPENSIDSAIQLPTSQASSSSSPAKKKGRTRKTHIANSSSIDYPSAPGLTLQPFPNPDTDQDETSISSTHRPSGEFEVLGQTITYLPTNRALSKTESRGTDFSDAIEVDQNSSPDKPILMNLSPMRNAPKKITFEADRKPQHSFFSRLTSNITDEGNRSRASSVASEDTIRTAPVVVRLEPKFKSKGKEKEKEKDKKKVHNIFKSGSNASEGVLRNGWGNAIKEGEELITPLPSGDWPTHSLDSQFTFFPTSTAGPSKRKKPHPEEPLDDGFWYSVLANADSIYSPATSSELSPFSLPSYITQHPAFASIPHKCRKSSRSNRDSWTDRYRPLKATEVLSNEIEAIYLKDWLSALSVGHQEGDRKVVRKVKRGGTRSTLLDGWIVDDLGIIGDGPMKDDEGQEEEEEELEELDDPLLLPDTEARPTSYPSLSGRLTNTILLTGPHGSGKSATIYAAAHELGWDIFEVFPGMGKRTSANLISWVGDVGRNHMVAQEKKSTPIKENKKGGLKSFFDKTKANTEKDISLELGSQGSVHEPIDIDMTDDNSSEDDIQILGGENGIEKDGKFRQSLILIDEADILFDEESTFWPAVITLIAESRRPVILTCNDHNLIPKSQLPLQAILQFRPPPSHIALPYLQAIAAQECKSSKQPLLDVQSVYAQALHQRDDLLDHPLPPNGHESIPYFDLRKAINQLQLDRNGVATDEMAPFDDTDEDEIQLEDLVRRLEVASFVDAWISPRGWMRLEMTELDRHYPTTDDQLGIHALIKPEIRESYPHLAGYDYSLTISDTLLSRCGGKMEQIGNLGLSTMKYIRSTLPILDPLIPLSSPLLPRPSLFLHTLPTILSIIETDDILQFAEEEAVKRGEERLNRKTGRPVRGGQGYTRWFSDLDEEAENSGRSLMDIFN